jgi:pilus assembly protein Flp/PilA
MNKLVHFVKDESGATAIEYGLIAAAIGLVLVATLPLIRAQLDRVFRAIAASLTTFT